MISIDLLIKIVFLYASVMTALFVLACVFTPVIPFLVARISRKHAPVFIILGNRIKVVIGKYFVGTLKTKNDGTFRETPGSGYLLKRIMCYFAYSSYGATLPIEYSSILQTLEEKGYPIHTYEDLRKIWDHTPQQATETIKYGNRELKLGDLKKEIIEYAPGKTILLGDLQYKFPTNDNPFINEAKEAAQISIERLQRGRDYFRWIIIIGGIVIVAYIAWTLFKNYGHTAPIEVMCKCPTGLISTVAENITI